MADKTGYLQAAVVYRVRASDGAPVGLDGKPISETGAKQAIAVLTGRVNPDPNQFVIQMFYAPEAIIEGEPTVELSDDCPTGYISLSVNVLIFSPGVPPQTVTLISSAPWVLVGAAPNYITIVPTSGPRGANELIFTRSGTIFGQGTFTFRNTETLQTVDIFLVNAPNTDWILATHAWKMLGFWRNTSLWGV